MESCLFILMSNQPMKTQDATHHLAALLCVALGFSLGSPAAHAATRTWDGGGTNNAWTNPTNWMGDVAPLAGDDLVFPAGAARLSHSNNFTGGTVFHSILFTGTNYIVSGNSLTLTAGISNQPPPGGVNTFSCPLTLGAAQNIACSNTTSLNLTGQIDLNDQTATFTEGGGIFATAAIKGAGVLVLAGQAQVVLSAANTFNAPVTVSSGTLTISHNAALGSASSDTTVSSGASLFVLNNITVAEPLNLSGTLRNVQGTNSLTGPITLSASNATVLVQTNTALTLSGVIGSTGGFSKSGDGLLTLAGTGNNTYAGTTTVAQGTLLLGKTAGLNAIPAALVVGDNAGGITADMLRLAADDQIADSAPVTVNTSGYFNANSHNETIGPLTIDGGVINTGSGVLELTTNVTSNASTTQYGTIQGKLSLGGATRTITTMGVAFYPNLSINAAISDGGTAAGLTKEGSGELWLVASNAYTGTTTINDGWLRIFNPSGLGTTNGGTIVSSNGTLFLNAGVSVTNEPLTLNAGSALSGSGTNNWVGNITLAGTASIGNDGASERLNLVGTLSGAGGVVVAGTVNFAGTAANTYSGTTVVPRGVLLLSKPASVDAIPQALEIGNEIDVPEGIVRLAASDQIADTAAVTIRTFGTLDLNSLTELIGSLAGPGNVTMGSGSLSAGANNSSTEFSGLISGTGGLVKNGSGTLTLSGTNTYTGDTTVNSGAVLVNGYQPGSPVVFVGGLLGGTGTVATVTSSGSNAKTLAPGISPGMLSVSNVALSSSTTFFVELNGTNAGVGYDQLNVTGTVNLASAMLSNSLGFTPALSNSFTIIANDLSDAVVGTFNGLAQDAVFAIGGLLFQINYAGGVGGNDVVLTRVQSAPSTITSITRSNNGAMRMQGLGLPLVAYTIQATINLNPPVTWTNLSTDAADGAGAYEFVDAEAPLYPQRFYRVLSP